MASEETPEEMAARLIKEDDDKKSKEKTATELAQNIVIHPSNTQYSLLRRDFINEEFKMIKGKFEKGMFVLVKPGNKSYELAGPGVLVYVTHSHEEFIKKMRNDYFQRPPDYPIFGGIALNPKNYEGESKWYKEDDFNEAPDALVREQINAVKEAKKVLEKEKWKTGDCVTLDKDLDIMQGFLFFTWKAKIRKGTSAVIDTATGEYEEEDKLDPNRGHEEVEAIRKAEIEDIKIGPWKLKDFIVPMVRLYFPESENEEYVPANYIVRKIHVLKEANLVLPSGYIEKIMRVVNRVVNRKTSDEIYEKLGLWNVCQKGRGALILLYGPPGTGKTMTAEVVADRIGRPLLRVNLGMFNNKMMEQLKEAFRRAQKYNAVLLLDEVDVFIRKREGNPLFDEHTAVFLRALEYYDGILFMTTNLIKSIDPAVFSRVHVCLGFETSTDERRAIWKGLLTKELLAQVRGNEKEHEAMFDRLSAIPINGREIKTVIQNAVSHAIYELNGKPIPDGVKWITTKYFTDEAESMQSQRDELKRS